MRIIKVALLITFTLAWLAPADAQLFSRKPRVPAAQRVGELIAQVKTDSDEGKRAAAAEELRDFDVKKFPEIVPVLIDVARQDKSANVRHDALDSLARIRPVSQGAGQMLEWAAQHDQALRNRFLAKTALLRYQWAGYHPARKEMQAPPTVTTKEPPLYDGQPTATKSGPFGRTSASKTNTQSKNSPRIVSQPPPQPPAQPTPPPVIVTQPAPAVIDVPAPPATTATPPPIIIGVPTVVNAPAPKAPAPALPVVNPSPNVISPNFRPAGVSPPRIDTPPAKTGDRSPALKPPM